MMLLLMMMMLLLLMMMMMMMMMKYDVPVANLKAMLVTCTTDSIITAEQVTYMIHLGQA